MNPEIPKNPMEEFVLHKPEIRAREILPTPELTPEQVSRKMLDDEKQITEIKEKLRVDEEKQPTKTTTSPPLSASEGNMQISFDIDAAKSFLIEQGLSAKQAADLKIEFAKLRWSNKVTKFLAPLLPGRFKEIFTRIESLKGDTLKVFINNLDAIYDAGDTELITRDTIHHLVHFVQRKKGVNRLKYLLTRLPVIHGLSRYEKEARNLAREIKLGNDPWTNVVQFSSRREKGNDRLKIEV